MSIFYLYIYIPFVYRIYYMVIFHVCLCYMCLRACVLTCLRVIRYTCLHMGSNTHMGRVYVARAGAPPGPSQAACGSSSHLDQSMVTINQRLQKVLNHSNHSRFNSQAIPSKWRPEASAEHTQNACGRDVDQSKSF